MSFRSLLNLTCSITRLTQTVDEGDDPILGDYGDPVTSSATTTGVKCRLDEEINTYIQDGKVLNSKEFILFLLPDTDVQLRDTITILNKPYVVTDVDTIYGSKFAHHKEVTISEMENNA
ncbi:MAG: hypothetical protein ACTSXD_08720 [Candidatus Heimdallarchaeaceae archaeon]